MPLPVPSDLPTNAENTEFSYKYFVHSNGPIPLDSRFLQGPSLNGRGGTFEPFQAVPLGQIPVLAPPVPQSHSKVMVKPQFQTDG